MSLEVDFLGNPKKINRLSLDQLHFCSLAVKNKELTHGVVEYHRCKNVRDKGVGGEKTEASDENTHQHWAKKSTYAWDRVKEKDLNDEMVFSTLKNKKNVGDIGNHVGNNKGDEIADHGVASPGGVINFSDGQAGKTELRDPFPAARERSSRQ